MSIICWSVENLIDLHADGRLGESQSRWVGRHLQACSSCGRKARELSALKGLLSRAPRVAAPAGLSEAIQAALRSRPAGARLGAPSPAQAAVLLYLSALVLAVQALPGVPSQSRQPLPWEVR